MQKNFGLKEFMGSGRRTPSFSSYLTRPTLVPKLIASYKTSH
jgi:hypothetical protein